MKWFDVFIKGIKEQIREYWILVLTLLMSPLFIAIYFLMGETEEPVYDLILVNMDRGSEYKGKDFNLGDSILSYAKILSLPIEMEMMNVSSLNNREDAVERLRRQKADVVVVMPEDLSLAVSDTAASFHVKAGIELVGDLTKMEYLIGAVWAEELINRYILEVAEIRMPVNWYETTLGFSGKRTSFELYVPGLLVLSIIMIIFSASSAIVREAETRTLERLRISRLSALGFLVGISLVQLLVAILSLLLALLTAIALGYTLIPGTFGFILLISLLTAFSMISFSLLVAAMCRSVKEVAIIGTFPLFLLMFFTGAAFPIHGGKLFSIGGYTLMFNDFLSPKFAIEALNKVLIRGLEVKDAIPEMTALIVLTLFYTLIGTWAFKRRHMRAQ